MKQGAKQSTVAVSDSMVVAIGRPGLALGSVATKSG
jgi:hypothetical protein